MMVVYVKYRTKGNRIYIGKKSINANQKPSRKADAFIIINIINMDYRIGLTKNMMLYANLDDTLIDVLTHEMIHYSLYQIGEDEKCNKGFDRMDKDHKISGYGDLDANKQ